MSRNKEYKRGIQTKLSLALGLLVLISLASFGLLSYYVTKKTLDRQMGDQLVSQAMMVSATLRSESLADWLSEISASSPVYYMLQGKLSAVRAQNANLDNIILIGNGNKVLADASKELSLGEELKILKQDKFELDSVWGGNAEASVLYPGKYGRQYKSAYAPVMTKDGRIVAVIRVEASADFLNTVNKAGLVLLTIALIITASAALLGVLIAKSIVVPIKKLVQASQRIAAGDLDTEVLVQSKDEIGFFAKTFNQMARNLKKLYEEVAEHGRLITELSASVAHEVRTPIGAIHTSTELLESELEDGDPRLEYTADIKQEIQILNSKVTDFIHFARPLIIEPSPLDITEVLESALVFMDKETADNNISVTNNFPPNIPAVMGDFEQLRSLFINLIRNAIQAMNNGGKLTVSANIADGNMQYSGADPSFVEIKIEDNGCGMSPEAVELAFEPFFTTKSSGTGLGLAIVKKIVNAHKGEIKLESTLGVGTTVKVFLPVR